MNQLNLIQNLMAREDPSCKFYLTSDKGYILYYDPQSLISVPYMPSIVFGLEITYVDDKIHATKFTRDTAYLISRVAGNLPKLFIVDEQLERLSDLIKKW